MITGWQELIASPGCSRWHWARPLMHRRSGWALYQPRFRHEYYEVGYIGCWRPRYSHIP